MTDTSYSYREDGTLVSVEYRKTDANTKHLSSGNSSVIYVTAQSSDASQTKVIDFSKIREKETYMSLNKRLGD